MKRRDFERLTLIYGGEPEKWPPEYRRSAARLLARAPDASRVLATVRALDSALWSQQPKVSDLRIERLRTRILQQARGDELPRFQGAIARVRQACRLAIWRLQGRMFAALVVGTVAALFVAWSVYTDGGTLNVASVISEKTDALTGFLVSALLDFLEPS